MSNNTIHKNFSAKGHLMPIVAVPRKPPGAIACLTPMCTVPSAATFTPIPIATHEDQKPMPDDDNVNFEDWNAAAASLLRKGLIELAGFRNGEVAYRLTERGKRLYAPKPNTTPADRDRS